MVCERLVAREAGGRGRVLSLSVRTRGVTVRVQPLCLCMCASVCFLCNESECVTEQEVRQTDVSLTQNILQTQCPAASVALAA